MREITFFDYLNAVLKKDKLYDQYYDDFKLNDNFKSFENVIMMKYLYQGNLINYANEINKYVYLLNKEEFFKLLYYYIPKTNIFIKYNKKTSKEKNEMLEYISKYYKISIEKSKDIFNLLSLEDCKELLFRFGLNEKEVNKIIEII
jgi:hypothetical protein